MGCLGYDETDPPGLLGLERSQIDPRLPSFLCVGEDEDHGVDENS